MGQPEGLFLYSPEVFAALIDAPLRRAFSDIGHESLYKGFDSARKGKREPTKALIKTARSLVPAHLPSEAKAIIGCSRKTTGSWNSFLVGLFKSSEINTWTPSARHTLSVEMASGPVARMLVTGNFSSAAEKIKRDPLLSRFLSHKTLSELSGTAAIAEWKEVRRVAALEVWLSIVIAQDADRVIDESVPLSAGLQEVLPTELAPFQRWYRWLERASGAQGPTELSARLNNESAIPIESRTLQRWRNGQARPSHEYVKIVIRHALEEDLRKDADRLFWGAVFLNYLGYVATTAPHSPPLPFSHKTVREWCWDRYPVWKEFHRGNESS